jgi:hypothetical protein
MELATTLCVVASGHFKQRRELSAPALIRHRLPEVRLEHLTWRRVPGVGE